MRENEIQGNISIDKYNEIESGYSVFESTRDFLAQWAKDNAEANADISEQSADGAQVARVCKVKVCKNGNLFIGCYNEILTKYVNFFVAPAIACDLIPAKIVKAVWTTTPKGHKVRTGWEWASDEVLNDAFKDLQVVYENKDILEVF